MQNKINLPEEIHFPNEILSIIMNELASSDIEDTEDNYETLASCRLASSVICSLATPVFFSCIRLTDSISRGESADRRRCFGERMEQLNQILNIDNIAASVRTFKLTVRDHQTFANPINTALMSTILRRLPYIRDFTLSLSDTMGPPWDFMSAIQALCQSPNFKTFCLDTVQGFPFRHISTCPNLRLLNSTLQFVNMNEISSPPLSYLDSLEIDIASIHTLGVSISQEISVAKYFSQIRNLQIRDPYNIVISQSSWSFMLLVSQTLATLGLDAIVPQDAMEHLAIPTSFDLGQFPVLRHIKIQLQSWHHHNSALLPFLTRLLSISHSASSSGIEILEIELTWHDGARYGDRITLLLSEVEWSALDQLLTSQVYDSLNKVVLHLCLTVQDWNFHSSPDSRQRFSEFQKNLNLPYVSDLFPMFRASTNTRRTLEIDFQVTY